MQQTTLMLTEEACELLDAAEHSARSHPDLPNKQGWQSEFAREIINAGIEELIDEDSDYVDILPDHAIKNYKIRRVKEEQKRQKRADYLKGGWQDYVRDELNRMLGGKHPHDPDRAERILDGHRAEMEILFDDEPDERERMAEWLDSQVEIYRAAYWAVEHADSVESELDLSEVDERFAVGEAIVTLREHIDDVVDHIRTVADGSGGWDSEAVIDSVAARWSVHRAAVHLLIESLVVGSDVQGALALGGDRIRDVDDMPQLEGSPDSAEDDLPAEVDEDTRVADSAEPTPIPEPQNAAGTGLDGADRADATGREVDEQEAAWLTGSENRKATDGGRDDD